MLNSCQFIYLNNINFIYSFSDLQWPILRLSDVKVRECLKVSEHSSEEQEQMIELLAIIESYMEVGATVQNIVRFIKYYNHYSFKVLFFRSNI